MASLFEIFHIYNTTNLLKILLFLKNKKSPSANAKGLGMSWLPQQNDFRTFCMSEETEKVYQRLKEMISIC
jgi:hypothetical protein